MSKLDERQGLSQDAFNAAATQPPTVAEPVSRVQLRDLLKQLSQPRLVAEHTPQGVVTRQARTDRDAEVLRRVEQMQQRLAQERSVAKNAFRKAHGHGM